MKNLVLRFSPPYEALSRFCSSLATCLEAGVGMDRSVESSVSMLAPTRLAAFTDGMTQAVQTGTPLSEAMSVAERALPAFFLPMLQAGEETGRLDDALRYLEHHCLLLAGPARALRNLWLAPLIIAIAGTAIQLAIYFSYAPWSVSFAFLFACLRSYALLAIIAWISVSSPVRPLLDRIAVVLPGFRFIAREIANNRFFHAMSMLYAAAGHGVDEMIRLSAKTVRNRTLYADFLLVAAGIERRESIPAAFEQSKYLPRDAKDWIESGDLAGTLERCFERISKEAADALAIRLAVYHDVSVRIMTMLVIGAITATVLSLLRWL